MIEAGISLTRQEKPTALLQKGSRNNK